MSLRRTQGHTIPATQQPTEAACTACRTPQEVALLVPVKLPGFSDSPALVCPDPVLCRRRAQAAGVWKAA
jgi:hypothetical protein